jgi:hypothetical protein
MTFGQENELNVPIPGRAPTAGWSAPGYGEKRPSAKTLKLVLSCSLACESCAPRGRAPVGAYANRSAVRQGGVETKPKLKTTLTWLRAARPPRFVVTRLPDLAVANEPIRMLA